MRAALAGLALVLALLAASPATAASAPRTANHRLGAPALHPGSRGPDVAALQWLLSGHKPYAFSNVKPVLKTYTRGISGGPDGRTWRAVRTFKFKIGFPGRGQCTSRKIQPQVKWFSNEAGPYLFALLLGHKQRPACWVALANKRHARALAGASSTALKLKSVELGQVGVYEPLAYYRYNAFFGLPPEAWCAILVGWSLRHVMPSLPLLAPSNPWYVPNIITWGRYHGYLRAYAKVGEFVLYYGDISHIGYVISVEPKTGSYTTVEGNWANHVAVVVHPPRDHLHFFLVVPWVT